MTYPDFLVIGAQKAGTTWLDRNLRLHPQIWLPPEKEIHFFDFPPLMPFHYLRYMPIRSIRSWVHHRMARDWRKVESGEQSREWFEHYYFAWRSRAWYASLFTPGAEQIAGETTPRYAVLGRAKVKHIRSLMPRCRIIYLLRNPVERMWSDVAMFHSTKFGHDGLETIDEKRLVHFLTRPRYLAQSRYRENLARWEATFPAAQIFIGFYDQIRDAPHQLMEDIYRFLGVDASSDRLASVITRKVNAQEYPPMPLHIGVLLSKLLIDEFRYLHRRFDNAYTRQWLESAELQRSTHVS